MTAPAMVAESDQAREAPAEGRRRALDAGEPFVVIAGDDLILLFALWAAVLPRTGGGGLSDRRRRSCF
ncbi:hypothetical protein [Nonomuraea sp. NPDC049480]|uniref:hypothetical protein n=1 Tax=Nonomuraea sp. NPDC049480 TaxID=3364353 RepID=UPI0037A5A0BE